jgi:hypothetical protein
MQGRGAERKRDGEQGRETVRGQQPQNWHINAGNERGGEREEGRREKEREREGVRGERGRARGIHGRKTGDEGQGAAVAR